MESSKKPDQKKKKKKRKIYCLERQVQAMINCRARDTNLHEGHVETLKMTDLGFSKTGIGRGNRL